MALRWLTLMLLLAQSLSTHFRPKMYLSRNKGGGGYTYTRKYPSYTQLMRKYGAKSENLTKLPKEGLNIYPRLHSNVRLHLVPFICKVVIASESKFV